MKHALLSAALALPLLPALPAQAQAQNEDAAPVDIVAALGLSPATPPSIVRYRYTVDLAGSIVEGDDPEARMAAKLRIDPSQPAGSRVTVVSKTGDDNEAAAEMIESFVDTIEDEDNTPETMAESFYCRLDTDVPFTVASQTPDGAVLRADPAALMASMQGGDDDGLSKTERRAMRKMAKRMEAEVQLDTPSAAIRSMSVRLLEPVTLMVVAKIRRMDFSQTCTRAPDGHMRSDLFTMETDAGAFGKSMQSTMSVRLRDLESIPG